MIQWAKIDIQKFFLYTRGLTADEYKKYIDDAFYSVVDDKPVNELAVHIYEKYKEYHDKQAAAGRAGMAKRYGKKDNTVITPLQQRYNDDITPLNQLELELELELEIKKEKEKEKKEKPKPEQAPRKLEIKQKPEDQTAVKVYNTYHRLTGTTGNRFKSIGYITTLLEEKSLLELVWACKEYSKTLTQGNIYAYKPENFFSMGHYQSFLPLQAIRENPEYAVKAEVYAELITKLGQIPTEEQMIFAIEERNNVKA